MHNPKADQWQSNGRSWFKNLPGKANPGILGPACKQISHASILQTGPPQLPERTPRYEFYSCKRTKKVQKPTPRYDPNFGK